MFLCVKDVTKEVAAEEIGVILSSTTLWGTVISNVKLKLTTKGGVQALNNFTLVFR